MLIHYSFCETRSWGIIFMWIIANSHFQKNPNFPQILKIFVIQIVCKLLGFVRYIFHHVSARESICIPGSKRRISFYQAVGVSVNFIFLSSIINTILKMCIFFYLVLSTSILHNDCWNCLDCKSRIVAG